MCPQRSSTISGASISRFGEAGWGIFGSTSCTFRETAMQPVSWSGFRSPAVVVA